MKLKTLKIVLLNITPPHSGVKNVVFIAAAPGALKAFYGTLMAPKIWQP